MKVVFLFTGKTGNTWIREGMDEYVNKIRHYCPLEVTELPVPKNSSSLSPRALMEAEMKQIVDKLEGGDRVILLDEKGKEMTSVVFAEWMNRVQVSGVKRVVFVVGGAFGFHEKMRDHAAMSISFSRMTFTHQMIRVILAEQLYRAFSILKGEKYHHE